MTDITPAEWESRGAHTGLLARIARKLKANKRRIWPGNDIGYFGPYESLLRGGMPRGHSNGEVGANQARPPL